MKIEVKIIESEETGKVRCVLQPPKKLDDFNSISKENMETIEKTCKVVWMEIDQLLLNLQDIK